MSKLVDKRLGNSVVVKLRGRTREGVLLSKAKKGQWVILYNEIPAVCMGNGVYAVYPKADYSTVEILEERNKVKKKSLYLPVEDNTGELRNGFINFCNGKRKDKFWESPKYFN